MIKKNILFLSSAIVEGGSEEIMLNLAKNLNKSKYNTYVTSLISGPMAEIFKANHINYIQPAGYNINERIEFIKKQIDKLNIGYIFCSYFNSGHNIFHSDIKTIEMVHGPYPWLTENKEYIKALNNCSKIVCVSQSVYDFMARNFDNIQNKMIVIENGIEKEKLKVTVNKNKIKEKLNIPDNSFIIGNLGRICQEKGIDRIVEMAKILNKQYNNLYFIIPGDYSRHQSYFKIIKEKIEDYDLNNIIFPGFIKNVADVLQIYDIFILPSLREGLQLAMLEALKMGLPVVTTNVGVVTFDPDMKDREIGFIVNNYSDMLFSKKIATLIDNKELREKIGIHNKKVFRDKYTASEMVNKYEQLIEQLEANNNKF